MQRTILPSLPHGTVQAPPSKSMAHRMLISAGLAEGTSKIHHIALSQDVLATLDCLKALGASYTRDENGTIILKGADLNHAPSDTLYTRESGSTLRFFVPICLLYGKEITLSGSEYLFTRPLKVYEDICRDQQIPFEKEGSLLKVNGRLKPGPYTVDGSISSQFISGLLFALPLLDGDSRITLLPPVESVPYILMTVSALKQFGVNAEYDRKTQVITIPGNQHYASREVTVEGDFSNAAFLEALNLIGGDVKVEGLDMTSLQGDKAYMDFFKALKEGAPEINISDCPDLGPVLFAAAALYHGAHFTGTRRLRIKECDRAAVMQEELRKFGMEITVLDNDVIIPDSELFAPAQVLDSHNDHRIVMALTTLCLKYGGTIEGTEAVRKSFPDYFEMLESLHAVIRQHS